MRTPETSELLHSRDAYQREFSARIMSISDGWVEFDRTCFFARAGGQAGDSGVLGSVPIVGTERSARGRVMHLVQDMHDLGGAAVGDRVEGRLNWQRRYRIMRLHTAQHLLLLAVRGIHGDNEVTEDEIGPDEASVRFASQTSAALCETDAVSEWVATIIRENLPVGKVHDGAIGDRCFWHVDGIGTLACGGTHVRSTGEVGEVDCYTDETADGGARLCVALA